MQVNTVVSGALDRLHYEKDPCVKYDIGRKLWIYLHRDRSQEEFGEPALAASLTGCGSSAWHRQRKHSMEMDISCDLWKEQQSRVRPCLHCKRESPVVKLISPNCGMLSSRLKVVPQVPKVWAKIHPVFFLMCVLFYLLLVYRYIISYFL